VHFCGYGGFKVNIDEIWYRARAGSAKTSKIASLDDCYFLYKVISKFKPEVIVEIGTWVGTTAYVMAQALLDSGVEGKIYTCDKHKEFTYWEEYPNIKYYNMWSGDFIKKIKGIKIDFLFADGRLFKSDCKKLYKMFRNKAVFMTHDIYDRKGKNNFQRMEKVMDIEIVESGGEASVLIYE